jgi:hypothetical protein
MSVLAPIHQLSVAETAEALGVSERTVWRYLRAGRLEGHTDGPPGAGRTWIAPDSVTALQESRDGGPERARLLADRERLVSALAASQAERDVLAGRCARLELLLARSGRSSLAGRLAGLALLALARLR